MFRESVFKRRRNIRRRRMRRRRMRENPKGALVRGISNVELRLLAAVFAVVVVEVEVPYFAGNNGFCCSGVHSGVVWCGVESGCC